MRLFLLAFFFIRLSHTFIHEVVSTFARTVTNLERPNSHFQALKTLLMPGLYYLLLCFPRFYVSYHFPSLLSLYHTLHSRKLPFYAKENIRKVLKAI